MADSISLPDLARHIDATDNLKWGLQNAQNAMDYLRFRDGWDALRVTRNGILRKLVNASTNGERQAAEIELEIMNRAERHFGQSWADYYERELIEAGDAVTGEPVYTLGQSLSAKSTDNEEDAV